ncbi:MAG: TusE/DsrC/DsvC family sulfur relay protein [Thiobacillus sp.]|jgi:tRNA 2-thiouridine synthesizing protein E|uniref:TusE/DsrC/DsvC family sulfur relay protein n=1 Tax=Thiobacillus sp. TaxID=924 RepID=UPI0027360F42|nr:TusE/DsrC/DsvC family sulfur relay protein [Thiobacillus sp.]MDP3586207.1 TusE/DsrC/DsvC family sulfur relay protein [Thiobacillus sp.]
MNDATQDFVRPGFETQPIPGFPHAPSDWSLEQAEEVAQTEGLELTEAHWEVVRALQELCTQNAEPALNARDLHDALDEHFHAEGGIKYLYQLFPEGPLAQGCLLAGVEPPAGTRDQGMGSAV